MAFKVVSKEANKIVLSYESLSKFVCNAQSGYSYANAYNCAILSALAYQNGEDILREHRNALSSFQYLAEQKFPPLLAEYTGSHKENGYQAMDFIEDTGTHTQGLIFEDDSNVYLAFRGTETKSGAEALFKDLALTDIVFSDSVPLKFGDKTYPCKVHRGFLRAFNSIFDQLKSKTPYFKGTKKPVIVCGHSLGGAIATIAAVYLLEAGISQINLYTYGSPRVGDSDFAKQFVSRIPTMVTISWREYLCLVQN